MYFRRSDMSPHTPPIATRNTKIFTIEVDDESSLDLVYPHSRSISKHRSPGTNLHVIYNLQIDG